MSLLKPSSAATVAQVKAADPELISLDASTKVLHRSINQKLLPALAQLQQLQQQQQQSTSAAAQSNAGKRKRTGDTSNSIESGSSRINKLQGDVLAYFGTAARQLGDIWHQAAAADFAFSTVVPQLPAAATTADAAVSAQLARLPLLLSTASATADMTPQLSTATTTTTAEAAALYAPDQRFRVRGNNSEENVLTAEEEGALLRLIARHNDELVPALLRQLCQQEAAIFNKLPPPPK